MRARLRLLEEPPPKQTYHRDKNVQEVAGVPKSKAKANARGRPKVYVITNKQLIPIGDPLQPRHDETPQPCEEELKVVDGRRDIKPNDYIFKLSPETITNLIGHKRRQTLENKQQILSLCSKAFNSERMGPYSFHRHMPLRQR